MVEGNTAVGMIPLHPSLRERSPSPNKFGEE